MKIKKNVLKQTYYMDKLKNLEFIFIGYEELFALPNLRKWNVNIVTSMPSMLN